MAALSDEDVFRIISSLEARGYEVRARDARSPDAGSPKVLLDEKYFRRIEKFTGETGKWQESLSRSGRGSCTGDNDAGLSGIGGQTVAAVDLSWSFVFGFLAFFWLGFF